MTLTFMSISFEVFGKDTVYNCDYNQYWENEEIWNKQTLKVEDPFFGERKLFIRIKGSWEQLCTGYRDVITDDSFKCLRPQFLENSGYPRLWNNKYYDYIIFDEMIPSFNSYFLESRGEPDLIFNCTKSE